MDFTDEEREVLFKSTMEKLWKDTWKLSIGNGNNRSYNGIYEYFCEIYGDGSFNGRDKTLTEFSSWLNERIANLEKAKGLLSRAEQYFIPRDDRDTLYWRTNFVSLKRRLAIIEAENDCGSGIIQIAEVVGKAMGKGFDELTCNDVVVYIREPDGVGRDKRGFAR